MSPRKAVFFSTCTLHSLFFKVLTRSNKSSFFLPVLCILVCVHVHYIVWMCVDGGKITPLFDFRSFFFPSFEMMSFARLYMPILNGWSSWFEPLKPRWSTIRTYLSWGHIWLPHNHQLFFRSKFLYYNSHLICARPKKSGSTVSFPANCFSLPTSDFISWIIFVPHFHIHGRFSPYFKHAIEEKPLVYFVYFSLLLLGSLRIGTKKNRF